MSSVDIERSVIKKFRKQIWCRFIKAVKEYELVNRDDKIAVCISGGKDSFLLAKCMQELERHGQFHFGLEFIVMDPGYTPQNRALIEENAQKLGVPIHIFESQIFEAVATIDRGSPCYLCARMRRGYLYEFAKKLGCNKIALGHHFDDIIETTLLSMFYGAEIKTMMPKLYSTSHPGMELIRPMYLIREEDIVAWAKYNGLRFLNCACRFSERVENMEEESKRREMKALIRKLKEDNPEIDKNIFRSMHNVNLDSTLGWRKHGVLTSFVATYEEERQEKTQNQPDNG